MAGHRSGFAPQTVAEASGLLVALGDSRLGTGQCRDAITCARVREGEVVMDAADGLRIGRFAEGPLEIGDRVEVAAGLVGEDAPVQEGGPQPGIAFQGMGVVSEGLVAASQGIRGQGPIEIAFGGSRASAMQIPKAPKASWNCRNL